MQYGRYARKPLDLNELLVRNPPATFFARMSGDDMTGMGIGSGDILVVDRSADPKDGDIVVLYEENEFLARRIRGVKDGKIILESDDGRAGKKTISPRGNIDIFGVVTACIKKFR